MEDQEDSNHHHIHNCSGCEITFETQVELTDHNYIFKYRCSHCPKHFDTLSKRVYHFRKYHQKVAQLKFTRTHLLFIFSSNEIIMKFWRFQH
jgi:hypothetical protein